MHVGYLLQKSGPKSEGTPHSITQENTLRDLEKGNPNMCLN